MTNQYSLDMYIGGGGGVYYDMYPKGYITFRSNYMH